MICYKDMTFCPFWDDCKQGEKCDRALTDEVCADAMAWWQGQDPPICQYTDKPECWEEI